MINMFMIKAIVLVLVFNMNDAQLPIPSDRCVISFKDFRDKVMNKDWVGLYGINDDDSLNPGSFSKVRFRWTMVDPFTVKRNADAWLGGSDECITAEGTFSREPKQKRAILTGIPGDPFFTGDRVDRFLSFDPERYFIWNICLAKPVCGKCPTSASFIMIRDQRTSTDANGNQIGEIILNNIPWKKVELTTKYCLGKTFTDTRSPTIDYGWMGPECRNGTVMA